jgi:cytochrome c biogenesis protein CcmG/thiol:disulfide interchange protein DsbE
MAQLSRRLVVATLPLLAAGAIAACGDDDPDGSDAPTGGGTQATATAPTKGLPGPLAENASQANELIDGSTDALDAKLDDLRGFPVVVNQWGSWCPPCRDEFPFFADVAEEHAKDVAFVGVDVQEDRGAAEQFLKEFPVPYPSIHDEGADAVRSLGWTQVSPTTWFIDDRGEIVYQRPGPYPDAASLEADLQRYLLDG